MEQLLAQLLSGGPGAGRGSGRLASSDLSDLAAMAVVPNHYAPMHGETFGGSTHNPEIERECVGCFGVGPSQEGGFAQRDDYCSEEAYRAALLALEAHEYLPHAPEQAARRAQRALQVSPLCSEAHNVLALCSGSLEAALGHYRRGEEVGLQVVPAERLEQELNTSEAWGRAVMRPYLRALFGVAGTLRKLGRYAEALDKYERLCRLSSKLFMMGAKPNWHAYLPELWMRVHGPQQCLARAAHYPGRVACVDYRSSGLWWLYNLGLAQFASGKVRDYNAFDANQVDFDADGTMWRLANAGHALLLAVQYHRKPCEFLLGLRPLPSNPIPHMMPGSESYTQAALYARVCGDMWRAEPGALDFLRKMYHTQCYATMLTNSSKRRGSGEFDPEAALRHLEAGVFPNVVTMPTPGPDITPMHGTVSLGTWRHGMQAYQARMIRALLKCGGNPGLQDSQGLTPLHQASYYAAGAETVRLLVDAGGDPLLDNGRHPSPLDMAANQGNADEMDAFLTVAPHLCTKTVSTDTYGRPFRGNLLEALLCTCLESSCLPCLAGGPKCQRCLNDCPHGLGASFHRCMDVLVKHGLRCSPRVLSMTREMVWEAPPSLQPLMKDVVQHLVAASCAATAAAAGPSSSKGAGQAAAAGNKAAGAGSTAAAGAAAGSSAAAAAANGAESSRAAVAAAGPGSSAPAQSGSGSSSPAVAAAAGSSSPGASASQPQQHKACAHCGTTEGKLLRCRGCRAVHFCSADCQKADWPAHKAACREVQAQLAAAGGSGGDAAPAGHS